MSAMLAAMLPRTVIAGLALALACSAHSQPRPSVATAGFIVGPAEGEVILGHLIKVDPARGAGRLGVGKQVIPAGKGIGLHRHDGEDEILYVERGRGIGVVGIAQAEIEAGSLLYIPQGAWHGITTSEETTIVWIVSPPTFASYLRDSKRAVDGKQGETAFEEIRRKHRYVDGDVFLREVVAGSRWTSESPRGELRFAASGMTATFSGADGVTSQLAITKPAGVGFGGTWPRPGGSADFIVTYDFSSGRKLTVRWLDPPQEVVLMRVP